MKKTPLAEVHERAGGRMVPFAGWSMPVQYGSIIEEVKTVRTACGLFDLTHMGRARVTGPQFVEAVDRFSSNHAAKMKPGDIRYTLFCNEDGGCLDDALIYREDNEFFVVINASNTERDLAYMRAAASSFDAEVQDLTDELAMIALQGPRSEAILSQCLDGEDALASLGYYKIMRATVLGLEGTRVSRTGYTGEDGFELYFPTHEAARVWNAVLEAGRGHGLQPIGLGARDTLRLEAGMALYGHEISEDINPLEAGLRFAVKFAEGNDFIGRAALERVKEAGPQRKLIGLETEGKRIARQGYAITHEGDDVGFVCSGTQSPTLNKNIATAIVRADLAEEGRGLSVDMRGTATAARVVPLPFYKRGK